MAAPFQCLKYVHRAGDRQPGIAATFCTHVQPSWMNIWTRHPSNTTMNSMGLKLICFLQAEVCQFLEVWEINAHCVCWIWAISRISASVKFVSQGYPGWNLLSNCILPIQGLTTHTACNKPQAWFVCQSCENPSNTLFASQQFVWHPSAHPRFWHVATGPGDSASCDLLLNKQNNIAKRHAVTGGTTEQALTGGIVARFKVRMDPATKNRLLWFVLALNDASPSPNKTRSKLAADIIRRKDWILRWEKGGMCDCCLSFSRLGTEGWGVSSSMGM